MDDNLETPSAGLIAPTTNDPKQDEREDLSDDEDDGGPDWANLPTGLLAARPVIPKRGEKDHEPAAGGETRLQSHVLDRARTAMLAALRAERGISSKALSTAVWHPALARAHVSAARGIHFASLGHSVARPASGADGSHNAVAEALRAPAPEHKRLELLPEEALYLIERGSMTCALAHSEDDDGKVADARAPMSVQQAFAAMIGTEGLSLEKYQVYSYLKRLGYVVTRCVPPSPAYPMPQPAQTKTLIPASRRAGVLSHLLLPLHSFLRGLTSLLLRIGASRFDCWHPLRLTGIYAPQDSASIYRSLRAVAPPQGHSVLSPNDAAASPYKVFFNLYKPATPFRKTAPPAPDFQIVVIDAQTTPMPTIHELDALFADLPDLPPPQPRKRFLPLQARAGDTGAQPAPAPATLDDQHPQPTPLSLRSRVRALFFGTPASVAVPERPTPRPNPFAALKQGKKIIVVAVVDAGSVGFFRFGEGCFEEWPMA